MPAPIAAVGSMMVQGVFKAGGLLTGLSSMVGKLKGAQQEGKSTSTEMKRMTGHAHLLRNALAMIGVGGFSALLMQTPALAGALAKIKNEMMLMANIVGRLLKPSFDAVATILQGIRTGDWSKIKAGVWELRDAVLELEIAAASIIIDFIWGEGTAAAAMESFTKWVVGVQEAWETGTIFDLAKAIVWPTVEWMYEKIKEIFIPLGEKVGIWAQTKGQLFGQNVKQEGLGEALRDTDVIGKWLQLGGYDYMQKKKIEMGLQDDPAKIRKYGGTWEQDQKTSIEKQENTFNIDMKGITGDIEDPSVLGKLYDLFTKGLREEQRSVTV